MDALSRERYPAFLWLVRLLEMLENVGSDFQQIEGK
jgi:hypothetical protein